MCRLFDEWNSEIENYCIMNQLSYEKLQKMCKSWGKNDIAFQYVDKEKGKMGLLDETPAPVVLWVRKTENGNLNFEQTEYTKKYLTQ
ncbi:MAG: hypothetical protein ACI4GY_07280 [Acutalibacteraceae bacterium]